MSKFMKIIALSAVILMTCFSGLVLAKVSPEEAAQLGKNLTLFGAEAAGNKEGTIPPYTGGLTKAPADYVPGSGFYTDPFKNEKPLFSINRQNMAQYADKLTDGAKALFKQYPGFRMDVYPTHRTVAYPDYVLEATKKTATSVETYSDGNAIKGEAGGIPFPIPKSGDEVMWNHVIRYRGVAIQQKTMTEIVDSNGGVYATSDPIRIWNELPWYYKDQNKTAPKQGIHWLIQWRFDGPVRKAGEGGMGKHTIREGITGPTNWLYLPGQRRVKLAPEVAFDTPNTDGDGNMTYDETFGFNGDRIRHTFHLLGKKEMYVPYSTYRMSFYLGDKKANMYQHKGYANPDLYRWELHRVWIVEARLRPGKRHIYPRRTFYVDEDSWSILSNDNYDAQGKMFHANFMNFFQCYDILTPYSYTFFVHNLPSQVLAHAYNNCFKGAYVKAMPEQSDAFWSPDNLAGKGLR